MDTQPTASRQSSAGKNSLTSLGSREIKFHGHDAGLHYIETAGAGSCECGHTASSTSATLKFQIFQDGLADAALERSRGLSLSPESQLWAGIAAGMGSNGFPVIIINVAT